MLTVSKSKFLERLDMLPESIRDAAFSLEIGAVLKSIAESHHLDTVRIDKLMALTAAVFFGFLHRTDFAKELEASMSVDTKIAQSVADEVAKKVFSRVQGVDLDRNYRPVLANEAAEQSVEEKLTQPKTAEPPILSFSASHAAGSTSKIPVSVSPAMPTKPENAPFVLHEERSFTADAKKDSMKGFSLPFGLFKPKRGEAPFTPRVTVEAPADASAFAKASADKKEEAKTVHYSEYRTNLAPGAGGEFINLETFGKTSTAPKTASPVPPLPGAPLPVKTPIAAPPTAAAPTPEATLQIKKIQAAPLPARTQPAPTRNENSPKVEGNTVDLRSTTNDL